MEQFAVAQAKIAKTHIVGTQAAVTALMQFMNSFAPAFIGIIARRMPPTVRKSSIDAYVALMENMHASREKFIGILEEYNLAGYSLPQGLRRSINNTTSQMINGKSTTPSVADFRLHK